MPSREEIVEFERRHVWPPWTSSERHEGTDPLVITRAEGPFIYDADGRRFIEANASWWACTLGHGHPRLRAALTKQAEELMHVAVGGITHPPIAQLAKELTDVAPAGLTRVHFSDDGSTAVEAAIKAAFQYWKQNGQPKRQRFVTLKAAYHGDTIGAASLASVDEFTGVFGPLLFEVLRLPSRDEVGGEERVANALEDIIFHHGDEIAGVIVEPMIQGAGGMLMHDEYLLRRLRRITQEADTFLIFDEVFTGYGRTGKMWAADHAGVSPDLMAIGKGFTAGVLPMAATLATERVYDGFRGGSDRALMHGHTFCGNPLGAAVAREVLAIYRDEDIVEGVAERAQMISDAFSEIRGMGDFVRTRTLGMVGAADIGTGGYLGDAGWRVFESALARGAFLRPLGDTVYVTPPLNIDIDVLAELLHILRESVEEALAPSSAT